ncbi:MAG: TSUP family transporter [Marinifilaceae bacterium]|jgi:uncharacterized membrane protein YfcA|nr:TSUP family transporter [Marinifilaceae bacterium]
MYLSEVFSDYSLFCVISLAILGFIAGFIDAIVGGGGLIQIPALLINFPNTNLPSLFGTNKIAALSGTSVAALQYSKKVKFNYKLLIGICISAFTASYLGAKTVSYINADSLKPLVLIILIGIAIYTFIKKDLGSSQSKELKISKQLIYACIIGFVVGFYDGFFGPGTGSFFVLGFVLILGFDFVQASAYAKLVNCITNISALIVFIKQGDYLIEIAILMAITNITGNIIGSKLALKKGNTFIRYIFLFIVCTMIIRYAYDIIF